MDAITNFFKQIREQFRKLSGKTRRLLLILLFAAIAFSVVIAVILNNTPYEVLFSDLDPAEASEIGAKLSEMDGVDYQISGDGTTIKVPRNQEARLKAQLVSEGYPKTGMTYPTYLTYSSLTSTDSDKQLYYLIDLQTRMEETIELLPGANVRDATVTISPGSEQRYVLEEDKVVATASVVVVMQDGGSPSAATVNGIQRLVSGGGVAGLAAENVVVLDGNGQEVSSGGTAGQLGTTQFKLELEREIERDKQSKILRILEPFYGSGNVRAVATATVNVDKTIRELLTYVPSEENRGVIESEMTSSETDTRGEGNGGVAGTETNAEVPVYPGIDVAGGEVYAANEQAIEYAVSQVKEQVQSDSGRLTDLTVAVGIIGGADDAARTAEIRNLIANATGISQDMMEAKISILYDIGGGSVPGTEDPGTSSQPLIFGFSLEELVLIGAGVLVFLIIVIMILTMVGKGKQQRMAEQALLDAPFAGGGPPQPEVFDIDLSNIPNTRQSELRDQIGNFTDENPEISAQLIRTWLRGVEEE